MKRIVSVCMLLALVCFFVSDAFAKPKRNFKIKKINFYYKLPPVKSSTSANVSGLGDLRKWGVLETTYSSSIQWADNLNVKYYVLLKDKTKKRKKKKVVFIGDVTYMNVPEAKGLMSFMYVHPYAIKRYGKVEKFLVEMWHDGVKVAEEEWPSKSKKEWWQSIKGISGNLYNKLNTPFVNEATKEGQIKLKVRD